MLFQDPTAPLADRIEDVIKQMTLAEKCGQLQYDAPAIERLGIPEYNWWNEALHGVARNGRATVFPQPIGLAATWDPDLVQTLADAISDEARAKHHEAVRRGSRKQYQGLTFWTPNVNMFRDPRWGRGMETWGEDPVLTGEMGAAFVRGLQGADLENLKTAACAKHYAVHSGPEGKRHGFDAVPFEEDFRDYYLPAFKRLVDEGVETIMPAYNRTFGEPCAGSKKLLEEILRKEWGFKGHVVTDCWAIQDFHGDHQVTSSVEESVAKALRAGTDLNCGSAFCEGLEDACKAGLIDEVDLDRALRRVFATRFKLGLLDPPCHNNPYTEIPMSVVRCEKHQELAYRSAADSFVLLKNNGALPLTDDLERLMVAGPNAASIDPMLGNYYGLSDRISTVLEGITARLPEGVEFDFRVGVGLEHPNKNPKDWAAFEAARRDVTIACMGISPLMEGEEGDAINADNVGDRDRIELPEVQVNMLRGMRKAINKVNKKTKLVVVLFSGSPIACPEVHKLADAVLWVGYPGEKGGDAIASVLWGDRIPGGRLPFTVPVSTDVLPDFEDYGLQGRTYRYMREEDVQYPFGFGLGYSKVSYRNLDFKKTVGAGKSTSVKVTLRNRGPHEAREVVQLYLQRGSSSPALVAFKSCTLNPKETLSICIPLPAQPTGPGILIAAGAAPMQKSVELGAPKPLQKEITFL